MKKEERERWERERDEAEYEYRQTMSEFEDEELAFYEIKTFENLMKLIGGEVEHLGYVNIDNGEIEVGDRGEVQYKIKTLSGNGAYDVYKTEKLLIIPLVDINVTSTLLFEEILEKYEGE